MDKNTTAFRERFKAYKEGKPVSEIYDAGLPRYAGGKRGYIGGSTKHARETVWNTDQTLSNAVDSIANAYLLKDGLLLHRLNEEGFTDKAIRLYNNAGNQSLYTGENLLNNKTDFSGVGDFGLDDAGTMILNNQMLLKGENWWDEEGENEQGRITHGAVGDTVRDTIGLQASALKYFSDQVKKDYPNLSDYDNARYTQAYYQRGVGGGRKWAKAGAKGYNFSTKPFAMRPAEPPYLLLTTIQNTVAPKFGKYANGKLPLFQGGKIGHNVSHAKLNDDGTFTDDYTKVFEDMYVTPQKTDLKRGSYTLNNFPYYLLHRTDWMKPFISSGTNEKGLELTYPEFDLLLGGRQLATTVFPLKKPSYSQFEEIDFDNIAKQAAKMKADDDAWIAAHPEYALENVLKPLKIFDVQGNIINSKSKDLLTRQINGWIELHGMPLQLYTDAVKTAYLKQIIPRRALSYANEQTTSGVSKINKYLKDNWLDDVDFSTKEGLQMAHDNGWSFEEMADWSDYKQYIQKLQQYSNGPWTKYEQESWKKLYPVRSNGSQVKGDYSTYNNKIRVVDYDGTDDTLLHEARHRMDNFIPLTKSEKNTLINAYGNIWADSQDEIITTNADLRNYLLKINNAENTGLQVLNGLLNNLKFVNEYDILNALDRVNSYGSRAVLKIQERLNNLKIAGKRLGWDNETINAKVAEERRKIADDIRYAITTVGGTSAAVTVSKK